MSLSRLSEKCKKCPKVDSCDHKRMEAYAYLKMPKISMDVSQSVSQSLAMPLARETMLINDGHGNMVQVYKDDIEKQIYKGIYEHLGLNYGA